MNGYLNILKPPGMSSAAVVAAVKRLTGENRVGHAGTLDPEAAGVLPVMVGRAARLFDWLTDKGKTYVAECAFGCETDTQDAQGTVTVRMAPDAAYPDLETVRKAAARLTGDIWQRPGAYSAVKQNGLPLYARARRGEKVEAPLRQVHIERIRIHGLTERHGVLMTVDCGRGTYIRSLCEDLGRLTGCPAHMRFLLRARSGVFTLDNAMTLEEAAALQESGMLADRLLPPDLPLSRLTGLTIPWELAKPAENGVAIPAERVPGAERTAPGETVRMYLDGRFLGIAERRQDKLAWRVLFPPEEDHE